MRRKYPGRLRTLLDEWDEEVTTSFVESKGVSLRNWRMFCLEAGVDGRKWKQREIAAEYKLTIARVSKILETTRKRLARSVEGCAGIGSICEYRAERRRFLWRFLGRSTIVNASVVNALTSLFRKHKVASRFTNALWPSVPECLEDEKYSIVFIAGGKYWRKVSTGCVGRFVFPWKFNEYRNEWWRIYTDERVVFPGYTIFWMVEDVEVIGNKASRIVADMHCIRDSYLVFDCEGSFWVMDKVEILREEKRLVVRLKPAEYGKRATKGGQQA